MSGLILPSTKQLIKGFSTSATAAATHKFTLPALPYSYSALEPAISGQIMETHHTKHHQTYVNNLNNAIAQYAEAEKAHDVQKMISLQPALRFNGGGHVNHSIFWTNLAPPKEGGGGKPTGELLKMIEASYGSFDKFKESMSAQSIGVQGSGVSAINKEHLHWNQRDRSGLLTLAFNYALFCVFFSFVFSLSLVGLVRLQ